MNINVNKKHAESTNLKKILGYLRTCLVMRSPKMYGFYYAYAWDRTVNSS